MTSETKSFRTLMNEFLQIRSFRNAFIVRGFIELILLSIIASVAYFYFPSRNLLVIGAVGLLIVTVFSFFIYKEYKAFAGKKENIILRIIGLILLVTGIYWFWKISDFALIDIWGIPLP